MTVIDIEDTVIFHRPLVGEETREIKLNTRPITVRRPAAEEVDQEQRRAFALVDKTTGELPLIVTPPPAYVGRHREKPIAPEPTPVPAWRSPEALASVVLPEPAVEDSRGPSAAHESLRARLVRWMRGAR